MKLLDAAALFEQDPDIDRLREAFDLVSADPARGRAMLEELASKGSVQSMVYLARAYGKAGDAKQAERWYQEAYARNSSAGLYGLGRMCVSNKNYEEATRIFLDGTLRNDGVSMLWLARLYLREPITQERSARIRELLEESTKQGQIRAMNKLAFLLMQGRYGARGIPRGVILYFRSIIDAFRVASRNTTDRRLW